MGGHPRGSHASVMSIVSAYARVQARPQCERASEHERAWKIVLDKFAPGLGGLGVVVVATNSSRMFPLSIGANTRDERTYRMRARRPRASREIRRRARKKFCESNRASCRPPTRDKSARTYRDSVSFLLIASARAIAVSKCLVWYPANRDSRRLMNPLSVNLLPSGE